MIVQSGQHIIGLERKMSLKDYHRKREELMRHLNNHRSQKEKILREIENLNILYQRKQIDAERYKQLLHNILRGESYDHIVNYHDHHINFYKLELARIESAIESEVKNVIRTPKILLLIAFLALGFFLLKPWPSEFNITGFFAAEGNIIQSSVSGYNIEGNSWGEIKGSRIYEKCLKVTLSHEFDTVKISGKIATASDSQNLVFRIYSSNAEEEPNEELGSCTVKEYSVLWKSCSVSGIDGHPGDYWICASAPSGDADKIYYTLAYQNGDATLTALWTGSYWQKLERKSYTMQGEFIKHG